MKLLRRVFLITLVLMYLVPWIYPAIGADQFMTWRRVLGMIYTALLTPVIFHALRIYRDQFSGKNPQSLDVEDMAPWRVRIIVWEANLWRRVWHAIRH